jgi:hypothetical protein
MWYANSIFALVSLAWTIFWYEQLKDGLSCSKNNVGKLFFWNVCHEIIQGVENLFHGQLLMIYNYHQ